MSIPAQKPATTPIPVQLSEHEFTAFILPHLSMPRRGPQCKLGYHCVFWVLYTGMQCVPPVATTLLANSLSRRHWPHDPGEVCYSRRAGRHALPPCAKPYQVDGCGNGDMLGGGF